MSRICVKNLPKYAAEDRLREVFSQKGEITDVKLMRTKDGKSRQFAFIGFRTEHEAEEAIKYFNKSYLDTSRISCEIARKLGDPDIPRPWSRHSKNKDKKATEGIDKISGDKNKGFKSARDVKKNEEEAIGNDDPQLLEFLQVMQPRVKSKLWANDTLVAPTSDHTAKDSKKDIQAKREGKDKPVLVNSKFDGSNGHQDEKLDNLAREEVISDMDYFKSRVKKEWSDSESESSENIDENDSTSSESESGEGLSHKKIIKPDQNSKHDTRVVAEADVEEEVPFAESDGEILDPDNSLSKNKDEKEGLLEAARLFVRNLPYTAMEDELEEHFGKFGRVSEVHLVVDKDTKRSKGIAYVRYTLPESATRALQELDNSIFQGRLLHVMQAKKNYSSNQREIDETQMQGSKTFKQRREDERKASEASGDTRAWNSLFMHPDTVVENIARRLGVRKSDLLDREADDLAVRIALGETQVIAETKKALINVGVNIKSLEEFAAGKTEGIKRSNHVILVKNMPYGSSDGELSKMFGKFGSLEKIILPPTKTLALVVFLEPSEARAAFKGLAYKRYKDAPLYLEWAPHNVLSEGPVPKNNEDSNNNAVGEHDAKRVMLEQNVEGISEVDIDPDRTESRSLFVKNLNFKTSEDSLQKHFSEQMKDGKILSVRIKKHLKNGKNVSMGFGFLEFDSVETATSVCTVLQGTVLDGHALILQLCHAKKDEQVKKKVDKDRSSTKLLVRNVAFEATEKDLRQLFCPFGQIKSLRLPMKFGNHRGFAFIEYVTKQEAQNALEALSSTHLYGRHLVLERAKEGESLEELRARTAAQFSEDQNALNNPTKLSKKRKNMAVLDEGTMKFQKFTD